MPSRPLPRYALRAGAAALTAGLLALGTASPGQAADGDAPLKFEFAGDRDSVEVDPIGSSGITFSTRNTGEQDLKNLTVTIDATAFKDQMSLSSNEAGCEVKEKLIIVCSEQGVNGGKPLEPGAFFVTSGQLRVFANSQPGFAGQIRISATSNGVPVGKTTMKAAVADEGLYIDRDGSRSPESQPGRTVQPLAGFRNFSTRTVQDVYVSVMMTQGLSYVEEFSNCEYGDRSGYPSEDTAMMCRVKGPVEPGATYDLDVSAVKIGTTALYERWTGSLGERDRSSELISPHRGTGRELKLTKRAEGPGKQLGFYFYGGVAADNSTDLEALGATLDGKAGQVVTAELGARNNGPATLVNYEGEDPGEDATSGVSVKIPQGTTAVKVPADCRATTSPYTSVPGARAYRCLQDLHDTYLNAGQTAPFVFDLRIDKPKALAPGSITVQRERDSGSRDYKDSNTKNNTAPITVTVDGKLGDGSTTSTGGTGSTSGGATATPGTGHASASPGNGGSATTTSGGTGSGSMADTGAGALPWYAAAAATALAAGGVLFTVARRRRAGRA